METVHCRVRDLFLPSLLFILTLVPLPLRSRKKKEGKSFLDTDAIYLCHASCIVGIMGCLDVGLEYSQVDLHIDSITYHFQLLGSAHSRVYNKS